MWLRRFNNALSVVVILVGFYILISPFLPYFVYIMRDTSPEAIAPYAGELADKEDSKTQKPIPLDNRIVIPSIGIDEPILEGGSIGVIDGGGTWRRPNTVNPDQPGNSVIVAHRYYGTDASTFYHLDKVDVGQLLAVYWEGSEILYEVEQIKIVDATEVAIEAQTPDTRLTLYTCHPIWTAKQRLVVIAKPLNPVPENDDDVSLEHPILQSSGSSILGETTQQSQGGL